MERASLNLLEQCWYEFIIEGKSANEEDVENDATAPDVDFWASIQLAPNDFWCSVIWTATTGLEEVPVCHDVAQAEVCNLDVHVLVQQQILRLQITMNNLMSVTVLDSANYLLKQLPSFGFSQSAVLDDVVETVPSAHIPRTM